MSLFYTYFVHLKQGDSYSLLFNSYCPVALESFPVCVLINPDYSEIVRLDCGFNFLIPVLLLVVFFGFLLQMYNLFGSLLYIRKMPELLIFFFFFHQTHDLLTNLCFDVIKIAFSP